MGLLQAIDQHGGKVTQHHDISRNLIKRLRYEKQGERKTKKISFTGIVIQ
jgi:hypothetical protein